MSHAKPLRLHVLTTWRVIAAVGKPMSLSKLERHPTVAEACERAHDSCLRALIRLCERGHLVHDGAGLPHRKFWWGTTCLLPSGEAEHPRFATAADAARALPRTAFLPVTNPLTQRATPLRSGGMDFRTCPSRRGTRLHFQDGQVTQLAVAHAGAAGTREVA